MADRYWVGGTETWNGTALLKWSTTSGGVGGAAVPTTSDDVYFDAASGAVTVTTGASVSAKNLSFAGFTGTFAGTNGITATGSLTLGAAMTRTHSGSYTLNSALTTNTITSNGISLASQMEFTGGGKWTLQDNFSNPTGYTFLTTGTVDLNDKSWTTLNFESNNNNVRAVNFGTQGMTLVGISQGVYIVPNITNMTYSGTPKITLSTAAASGSRQIYNGSTAGGSESKALSVRVSAGTDNIQIVNSSTNSINDFDMTGFAGRLTGGNRTIYGSLTLGTGMTVDATTGDTIFGSTSGVKTITSNGVTFDGPMQFNGVGGNWQMGDNLIVGTTRTVTLINGTLDGNGKNVTLGTFALGSGTKTLSIGNGTWTVTASGTSWSANTNVANLTVSSSTGKISMTSASAKTFSGGAKAWPTLNQGGSGALTIQQSNSFANITNSVQPATITLTAGTTQTVAAFGASGTAGNLITLNTSTSGTRATLIDTDGTNEVSNVSIKDINATGGAIWNAFLKSGNVDAGNNSGWDFFQSFGQVFGQVFNPIFRPVFQ
jgi:hypothetical protein